MNKPIICTYLELAAALEPLHMNQRVWLDSLHDVWLKGAPTPTSIIRLPKGYDPRVAQPGNFEARIIPPPLLAAWVKDCATARGIPLQGYEALNVANGREDYHIPESIQITKGN